MSTGLDAYAGRSVLITGHTGFKGAWLAVWLTRLGTSVTGYATQPPTEPNLFTAAALERDINHVVADVRDRERLGRELDRATCRAIARHRLI